MPLKTKYFLSDGFCVIAAADCPAKRQECPPATPIDCGGKYPLILYIVFLGGSNGNQTLYYDSILEFSPDTEAWTQIGVMASGQAGHSVANVNFEDFQDACFWPNG